MSLKFFHGSLQKGNCMKIQVNTGHDIENHQKVIQHTETIIESILGYLASHITRIEVHISDENSKKEGGLDKRCMIEARLKGHQPIAVTDMAETVSQAIGGAADKLKSALDHTLGKLSDHEGRKHHHAKPVEESVIIDDSENETVIWKPLQ
jgi:ribosome-associated translation inhibitor RaiA